MRLPCLQRSFYLARLVRRWQDLCSSVGRPLNRGRKYLKRNRAGNLGSGRSASRPHQKKLPPANVGEYSRSNQKPHSGHPCYSQLATRNSLLATRNSQLATRNWQLATGIWQLATRHSHLAPRTWLLAIRYSLLATRYSLFATHYSLLTTHHSLLTTHYSLLATHYSLVTTH